MAWAANEKQQTKGVVENWKKPEVGWIKCNFDGVWKDKRGKQGCSQIGAMGS